MTGRYHVHIIGLDGGCWSILEPLIAQGSMPNLAGLLETACYGDLKSTLPPYSAPAWASFMTGANPGKTGVFSLTSRSSAGETNPVTGADIKPCTFMDYAGNEGLVCTSVNMPMTWPPGPIHGALVSGLFTPPDSAHFTYPESLGKQILEKFPGYHPAPFSNIEKTSDFIRKMIRFTGKNDMLEEWIAAGLKPDIRIQVIQATDILQHFFIEYINGESSGTQTNTKSDLIKSFYKLVDDIIGKRMKILEENGIFIIVSDHGFSRLTRVLHINRWLEQNGFLKRSGSGTFRNLLQNAGLTRKNIVGLARRLDIFNFLNRLQLNRQWEWGRKIDRALAGTIDWTHTLAFCGEMSEEAIYLNRRGRFAHGIVDSGKQTGEITRQVLDKLNAELVSTDGKLPLTGVFTKEDIYSGPEIDTAPEIILEPAPDCLIDSKFSAVSLVEKTDPGAATGRHERNGLFLFAGPVFKSGKQTQPLSITDMAPTIMHLLGIGVPETMDGRVPEYCFQEDYIKRNPVISIPALDKTQSDGKLSETEKQGLIDKLKSLGYL